MRMRPVTTIGGGKEPQKRIRDHIPGGLCPRIPDGGSVPLHGENSGREEVSGVSFPRQHPRQRGKKLTIFGLHGTALVGLLAACGGGGGGGGTPPADPGDDTPEPMGMSAPQPTPTPTPSPPSPPTPVARTLVSLLPDGNLRTDIAQTVDLSPFFENPAQGTMLTFDASGLPEAVRLTPEGLLISEIQANLAPGGPNVFTVTVTASDGTGNLIDEFSLTLTDQNSPPVLLGTVEDSSFDKKDLPETVSLDLSDHFLERDLADGLTFTLSGPLPEGLVFEGPTSDQAGLLHGTLGANLDVGAYSLTIGASDGFETTTSTFIITIEENAPPEVRPGASSLFRVPVGGESVIDLEALFQDPDGDELVYSLSGVPAALETAISSMSDGESITIMIPDDVAPGLSWTFSVIASDPAMEEATLLLTLETVEAGNLAPFLHSDAIPAQTLLEGVDAMTGLADPNLASFFSDDAGDPIVLTASNLPAGLTLEAATGLLSGSVTDDTLIGTHTVMLTASDGMNAVEVTFDLTIVNVNEAPQSSGLPTTLEPFETGESLTWDLSDWFDDPDTDDTPANLTYRVTLQKQGDAAAASLEALSWLTLMGSMLVVSDQTGLAEVGTYTLSITVSDDGDAVPAGTTPPAVPVKPLSVQAQTAFVIRLEPLPPELTPAGQAAFKAEIPEGDAYSLTTVSDWFTDPNGDTLTYRATIRSLSRAGLSIGSRIEDIPPGGLPLSSDPSGVDGLPFQLVFGNEHWLQPNSDGTSLTIAAGTTDDTEIGVYEIIVSASDGREQVSRTLTLEVTDVVETVKLVEPLRNLLLLPGEVPAAYIFDLNDRFTITDATDPDLVFEASSQFADDSDENIVSVELDDAGTLTLSFAATPRPTGALEAVTVTAFDAEKTMSLPHVLWVIDGRDNNLNVVDIPTKIDFVFPERLDFDYLEHGLGNIGDIDGDNQPDFALASVGDGSLAKETARINRGFLSIKDFPSSSGAGELLVIHDAVQLLDPNTELGGGFFRTPDPAFGFSITGPQAGARLGHALASAGDFNGDGLDDFAVGALFQRFQLNGMEHKPGGAYVFFGKPETPTADGAQFGTAQSGGNRLLEFGDKGAPQASDGVLFQGSGQDDYRPGGDSDRFGWDVSSAGDINGDGLDDLIVSEPRGMDTALPHSINGGAVYVFYGTPQASAMPTIDTGALTPAQGFIVQTHAYWDYFGASVADLGDINGDGLGDFIIGNPNAEENIAGHDRGFAYVIFGKADPSDADDKGTQFGPMAAAGDPQILMADELLPQDGFVIQGRRGGSYLGASVAGAGDVNGDGLDDILVGAPGPGGVPGEAYVIFGKPDPSDPTKKGEQFGSAMTIEITTVTFVGDEDGVLNVPMTTTLAGPLDRHVVNVGELAPTDGFTLRGQLESFSAPVSSMMVRKERGAGFETVYKFGTFFTGFLGTSVASAGDVNGDGFGDFIVADSVPRLPDPERDSYHERQIANKTYLVYGMAAEAGGTSPHTVDVTDSNAWNAEIGLTLHGKQEGGDLLMTSASGAGDVDGDGFDDLLGAYINEVRGQTTEGSFYLFRGMASSDGPVPRPVETTSADGDLVLRGGPGHDTLTEHSTGTSPGSVRVFYGGAGNDHFKLANHDFLRIDGGHGNDTVELAMSEKLDLIEYEASSASTGSGNTARYKLRSIETLSLNDSELMLDLLSVYRITDQRDNGGELTTPGQVLLRLAGTGTVDLSEDVAGAPQNGEWVLDTSSTTPENTELYRLENAALLVDAALEVI